MVYFMDPLVDYRRQAAAAPTRRYQIQEKTFSMGDNFKIKDETGRDVYKVRSKLLSVGDKLVLEDMGGKIREEVLRFQRTYNLVSARNGDSDRQLGVIKKKFSFLHKKFEIDSIYGEYTLEGLDVFAHSFALKKNGQTVANVSKKLLAWSDSYEVEVVGTEDQPFILSLIIALDQAIYDKRK